MRGFPPTDEYLRLKMEEGVRVVLRGMGVEDGIVKIVSADGIIIAVDEEAAVVRTARGDVRLAKEELISLTEPDAPTLL